MSLPVGTPSIVSISDLRERLGKRADGRFLVSISTIHEWLINDVKWRGCIVHASRGKIWLSMQKLIDLGILPRPAAAPVVPLPGLSFTYEAKAQA